jgi:hypothetical protein
MSIRTILISAAAVLFLLAALFLYPSINRPINAEQSKFTGNENHRITLQEAMDLTKAFQVSASSDAVIAHYFGKKALEEALTQPGCTGLRMYYAKHKDGSPTLVIVGVDHDGNDMTGGITLQLTIPCPPDCPQPPHKLKHDNSFATLK